MRQLEISLAVQAEIDSTWNRIEQEDWLLIEEKALEWLEADLAVKANLLPLAILSEALPKYIGFEDVEIDRAVLEAAFWVLGRPTFSSSRSTEDRNSFDESIEDRSTFDNESMNDEVDAHEAVLSELEIHTPNPPSSPPSRSKASRR